MKDGQQQEETISYKKNSKLGTHCSLETSENLGFYVVIKKNIYKWM